MKRQTVTAGHPTQCRVLLRVRTHFQPMTLHISHHRQVLGLSLHGQTAKRPTSTPLTLRQPCSPQQPGQASLRSCPRCRSHPLDSTGFLLPPRHLGSGHITQQVSRSPLGWLIPASAISSTQRTMAARMQIMIQI